MRYESFGAALRAELAAAGLSVTEIAEKQGYSRSQYFRKLADAENAMSVADLRALYTAIGLSQREAAALTFPGLKDCGR